VFLRREENYVRVQKHRRCTNAADTKEKLKGDRVWRKERSEIRK
jgi:hypothetical protein